jgi:hypothetical protein
MISTKNIPTGGGGGVPKVIQPGNVIAKILGVELEPFKFKEGAEFLVLMLETEPIGGDFDGFAVDKDDPTGPKHKGQIARVKTNEYAYADSTTKTGINISKETEIVKILKNLCVALDCVSWLEEQDGKHATVKSLVEAFNIDQPFKDIYLNWCIAGKEYQGKTGYTNYDTFLPKFSKTGVPFEAVGVKASKLIAYNPTEHIRKKKTENVSSFSGDTGSDIVNSDFEI